MVHRLHAVLEAVLFLFGIAAAKRQSEVWFKKELIAFGFPSSEEAGADITAGAVMLGFLLSCFVWHLAGWCLCSSGISAAP